MKYSKVLLGLILLFCLVGLIFIVMKLFYGPGQPSFSMINSADVFKVQNNENAREKKDLSNVRCQKLISKSASILQRGDKKIDINQFSASAQLKIYFLESQYYNNVRTVFLEAAPEADAQTQGATKTAHGTSYSVPASDTFLPSSNEVEEFFTANPATFEGKKLDATLKVRISKLLEAQKKSRFKFKAAREWATSSGGRVVLEVPCGPRLSFAQKNSIDKNEGAENFGNKKEDKAIFELEIVKNSNCGLCSTFKKVLQKNKTRRWGRVQMFEVSELRGPFQGLDSELPSPAILVNGMLLPAVSEIFDLENMLDVVLVQTQL